MSGLVRTRRREIGTPWRALDPGQRAIETVELLAARAPKLREALRKAERGEMACVIIDDTVIPIDRITVDQPFCSGEHTSRCEPAGHRRGASRGRRKTPTARTPGHAAQVSVPTLT